MALNIQVVISALDKTIPVVNNLDRRMRALRDDRRPFFAGIEDRLRAGDEAARSFNERWQETIALTQRAGATISGVGAGMTALGGGMLAGLMAAANQASALGSELNDMSARTGISVAALSELKYAAEQTGGSLETVEKAARMAQRTADEAAQGTGEYAEAYERLGVKVLDSSGKVKDGETLLMEIGAALRNVTNDSERTALAMMVFGRSGTQMLPMIMSAKDGIAGLRDEARKLGLSLSDEQVQAMDDYGDSMDRMKATAGMAFAQLGMIAMPTLQKLVDLMTQATAWMARFSREHPTLANGLTLVAVAAGGLMLAFGPILLVLGQMLMAIPSVIALWDRLTAALGRNAVAAQQAAMANTEAGAAAQAGGAGAGRGGLLGRVRGLGVGPLAAIGAAAAVDYENMSTNYKRGGIWGAVGWAVADTITFRGASAVRGMFGGGKQVTINQHIDARGASPTETEKAVARANQQAQAEANYGYARAY